MNPFPTLPRKALFLPIEAAEIVGVSKRTVQRHMNEGAFGPLWVKDNQRKITYQGLKSYLESHLQEPGQ